MNFLKSILNFYLNASVHVALSVYAFVRITEVYFDLLYNESLNYFIFYGTITGYNFVKYFGIAKFHHRSLTNNLKVIQLFSLACFVLMCYYAWQLSIDTLLFFVPFAVVTVLYAIPFLSGFKSNLRSISYLKIIIVALVWAGVTVLLPLYSVQKTIVTLDVQLAFIQRFLLVAVLVLPFDIRDVQFDVISLQTIPRKIGIEQTKKLGYILLMISLVFEFVIVPNGTFRNVFLIVFCGVLFLLMRARVNQSKYYSSFWVEAIPIFWFLLLWASLNF